MELAGKIGHGVSFAISGHQQSRHIATNSEGIDIAPIEYGGETNFRRWDVGTFTGMSVGWHFPFGTLVAEYELYFGYISGHEYLTKGTGKK